MVPAANANRQSGKYREVSSPPLPHFSLFSNSIQPIQHQHWLLVEAVHSFTQCLSACCCFYYQQLWRWTTGREYFLQKLIRHHHHHHDHHSPGCLQYHHNGRQHHAHHLLHHLHLEHLEDLHLMDSHLLAADLVCHVMLIQDASISPTQHSATLTLLASTMSVDFSRIAVPVAQHLAMEDLSVFETAMHSRS